MASHLDSDIEPTRQFERRKQDHIELALADRNQATGFSGLEKVELIHEALPELDWEDISIECASLKRKFSTPFLISSMTAGHRDSISLNERLAVAAEERGWRMGVGSQRRELGDAAAAQEWKRIRKLAKKVEIYGNLGLAQVIHTPVEVVERLVEALEASAMIVHLNALQECIQPEGTPQFRGGIKALKKLVKKLSVPVIVKETGCGFSRYTLEALKGTGVAAVDVSGLGGTHWGRIEGDRHSDGKVSRRVAETMAIWGHSTVDSVKAAREVKPDYEIWASGGVRSGLDAAKLIALGATTIGLAAPVLAAALQSDEELRLVMETLEAELKVAMFCTGSASTRQLQRKKVWRWV
ncbi:MAG: type 2 isopentenyl-diphosphate Delta-isomerase [Bdellovibrionales bacterium]